MSGEIPTSIGNLTSLEELRLQENQLQGVYDTDPVLHLRDIRKCEILYRRFYS
jgi:hypothetical protein